MQVLLEAFYRKHNPAKIADAPYVVNVHWTKQDLLNQKLREAYGEDLSTFDEGSKGGGHTAPRKGGCQVQ
ncbi:hypothetical protein T484DRAFT_1923575 [Baffinella frigidus]|nr:hypothetical protein T484DRAFT_1923575 [Cryptophyta sp. CCMP2293]